MGGLTALGPPAVVSMKRAGRPGRPGALAALAARVLGRPAGYLPLGGGGPPGPKGGRAGWRRLAASAAVLGAAGYALVWLCVATARLHGQAAPQWPDSEWPIINPKKASATENAIPRIIHQTFKSRSSLGPHTARLMATWPQMNPTWKVMYWDDAAVAQFVEQHYPQYLEAFEGLATKVEQADFFRYLIVYHYGGLYADTDVECYAPLDPWVPPHAEAVIGLENEFAELEQADDRGYVRTRQYLQWAFMAQPKHPVMLGVVEMIRDQRGVGVGKTKDTVTLEKTGPGIWTDAVYEYVGKQIAEGGNLENFVLLPKAAWGAFQNGCDGVHPIDLLQAGGGYALHHFSGSWKAGGLVLGMKSALATAVRKQFESLKKKLRRLFFGRAKPKKKEKPLRISKDPPLAHVPVTVPAGGRWVNVFVGRLKAKPHYDGRDPDGTLSVYGNTQGGLPPGETPSLADVLLSVAHAAPGTEFIDVGPNSALLAALMSHDGVPTTSYEFSSDLCERAVMTKAASRRHGAWESRCLPDTSPITLAATITAQSEEHAGKVTVMHFGAGDGYYIFSKMYGNGSSAFDWTQTSAIALELNNVGSTFMGASLSYKIQPMLERDGFQHVFHAGRLCFHTWYMSQKKMKVEFCAVFGNYDAEPEACRCGNKHILYKRHPTWCYFPLSDAAALRKLLVDADRISEGREEQVLITKEFPEALSRGKGEGNPSGWAMNGDAGFFFVE